MATFTGSWLVTEYVYDPDGRLAGRVHQRRSLSRLEEGPIEVRQHCRLDDSLLEHPMADFAGEHVFTLSVAGRRRHYNGPAVIGGGFSWADGILTGRGFWPDFGYHFTSWAVLDGDIQYTGGRFLKTGALMAEVVGIATAETNSEWPSFEGAEWPGAIANRWTGVRRTFDAAGRLGSKMAVHRHYVPQGWHDDHGDDVVLTPFRDGWRVSASHAHGLARRLGWTIALEYNDSAGHSTTTEILLDAGRRRLIERSSHYDGPHLTSFSIALLSPEAPAEAG